MSLGGQKFEEPVSTMEEMEAQRSKQQGYQPASLKVVQSSNQNVSPWLKRKSIQRRTTSFEGEFTRKISEKSFKKSVEFGTKCAEEVKNGNSTQRLETSRSFPAIKPSTSWTWSSVLEKIRAEDQAQGYFFMQGLQNATGDVRFSNSIGRKRAQSMPAPQHAEPFIGTQADLPRVQRNGPVYIKNNYVCLRKYSLTSCYPDDFQREIIERRKGEGNSSVRRLGAQQSIDSKLSKNIEGNTSDNKGRRFSKIEIRRFKNPSKVRHEVNTLDKVLKVRKESQTQLPEGLNLASDRRSRRSALNAQNSRQFYFSTMNLGFYSISSSEDEVNSLKSYNFKGTSRVHSSLVVSKSVMYARKNNILSWLHDVHQHTSNTCWDTN